MSFLVHLDACIDYVRNAPLVTSRAQQNAGVTHVSAVTLMGLALWLFQPKTPFRYHQGYAAVTQQLRVLPVDEPIAFRAARLGARLRRQQVRSHRSISSSSRRPWSTASPW